MPFPSRPTPGSIVKKVQSLSAQIKPPVPPAAAIQAVKQRAQAALGKLRGASPLKSNPLFQEYLEVLMSETAEGQELKDQMIARAREELDRRRGQCVSMAQALRPLQSMASQLTFRREVLRPAQTRSMSSQDCLTTLTGSLSSPTKAPILDWLESVFGPMTFGFGGSVEGGAGLGMEGAMGIAFRRGNPVAVTHALTLALGAYAEGTASIFGSVAGGIPKSGDSITMDVSLSAASGVSGEVVVSLTPTLRKPTLAPDKKDWDTKKIFGGKVYQGLVVDYAFAGLAVSLGAGMGLGGAIGFTGTNSILLSGHVK